ncbi:hypothetical protein BCU68_12910 [Vibrio sp. 10N.286.49.B3]|uniref:hypothetical protein n=1 Tax=Vibrio sp. 10N.286.49.B3 TaxID=1880855 RepID=UPI000C85AF77|nr:hypothetical protein [Vibrio sp. 10N.286.49.B3]PMH43747.1 hypothetical protein BCU68_12910 [Vibrio sp. 10N.286.49.B3]
MAIMQNLKSFSFKYSIIIIATSTLFNFSNNVIANDDISTSDEIINNGQVIFQYYGIADDLPKLGLSSLSQGDHLVEHITRSIRIGDDVRDSEAFLIQSTDAKGNIDLRIKYNPEKLAKGEDVIAEIEKNTRTEYRLRDYAQSYDPSSVSAKDLDDNSAVISFNYSKYGLPQDIAYFRFMNAEITIKNNIPVGMVISNSKPFYYDNYKINSYRQDVTFQTLKNGQVIIENKQVVVSGISNNKKQQPLNLALNIKPIAYYGDETGVTVLDEELLSVVSDPRIREESVKLDRIFPLMGDIVRRKGIDIPLPYGISVAYRNQDMNLGFTDLNVMDLDLNDIFDPEESFATVKAESLSLRGDLYILPFWNVYGILGKVNIDANVNGKYTGAIGEEIKNQLNNRVPGLGNAFCNELSALCNPGRVNLPLHLEYDVLGAGTTLSVGYREFFASLNGTYSMTRLKGSDTWGDGILTVQPMIGYQLVDYRTQVFVGAEYQGLKPYMSGKLDGIEIGGETFTYNVGVDLNKWAYMVGVNKQLGKHYNLTALYNKGESRNSVTLSLGYRF